MKRFISFGIIVASIFTVGCTRVETGKVGIRIGWDKQVKMDELYPGSFNETVIGNVLTFPVRDISVPINNVTPITKDNHIMKNVDMTVVYSINPNHASELYASKDKNYHISNNEDILLMFNYIFETARDELHKISRDYEASDMNDNRAVIEQKIRENIQTLFVNEKLDGIIALKQVNIRKMSFPENVAISSSNNPRESKQKDVEVKVTNNATANEQQHTNIKTNNVTSSPDLSESLKLQAMLEATRLEIARLEAAKKASSVSQPVAAPVDSNPKTQVGN